MLHSHDHHAPLRVRAFVRMLACALAIAATLVAVPAYAATYNSLNIISYETWRASSAMSVADIQAFLDTQTGPLKSYVCTDTITSAKPARRSAASIIWRSAQAWNLNPRVILATLQKEQSLITLSNSSNAARLVKAMGCGVYGDANHDGKTDNRFPGFASQIYNGARVLSTYEVTYGWYAGKPKAVTAYKYVDATKTVDARVVTYQKRVSYTKYITPANACTFSLYTFTPYYPQKLFWDCYTRWFGDPQSPPRLRPLYRFRSLKTGTYLYTASEAKRYRLIKDSKKIWAFEGATLSVDTSATGNSVPLYQLYNTRTHKYLYTTLAATRDRLLKVRPKQWRYDTIVCYVSRDTSGTAPVYKLEKKSTHGILFTSSAKVKTSLSTGRSAAFVYRGIGFRLDSLDATPAVGPTP
ncbi:MAG TPA: hypothetical protein VIL41_05940 [Coriobacteriia bacterium]